MADADKTTATDEVESVPDRLLTPSSLAQKNANGGWKRASSPEGGSGPQPGPSKNIGGTR
jgi:hypothetical protein